MSHRITIPRARPGVYCHGQRGWQGYPQYGWHCHKCHLTTPPTWHTPMGATISWTAHLDTYH